MKDITGLKYKRLTAIKPTDLRKNGCVIQECKCDCGNIVYAKGSDLLCKRKGSCGCLEKENQETFSQRANNRKDITGQKFGRLTALYPKGKDKNNQIIWHCSCDCGGEKDVITSKLGKSVFSCGCLAKEHKQLNPYYDNSIIGNKYGKLTVINYINNPDKPGSYWNCKCDCGNNVIVSRQNLVQGRTFSCGCLKESHGEFIIKTLLSNANIPFQQEYKVNVGYKSGFNARFDFLINTKDNSYYLIEYDGEQHYKNTGYGILKENQERDEIKNQQCKENNIPLIRIPYTHLKDLCIEDLKLETTTFLVK